jgi:hypothetical protein
MSVARRILRELAEEGAEIATATRRWITERFGDTPETPENVARARQAVREAARPRAADFAVPRAQSDGSPANAARRLREAAAEAQRTLAVRRQPASELRELPTNVEHRVRERPRVQNLTIETTVPQAEIPEISIYDLEGQPFITSMSDLSAAGDEILSVNDVTLPAPVARLGGQDFMFNNEGSVWAADKSNAAKHMGLAARLRDETGRNPVYFPWAMGPGAIDFTHMPRELMLQYAAAQRGRRGRNALSRDIRDIMPDFRDVDDPASLAVFRGATGRRRGQLNRLLDQMRTEDGMGLGEARLAMSDTSQIGVPLTSLRNVGVIDAGGALSASTHPTYHTAIPGEGLGRLREQIGALELLPELSRGMNDPFAFPVGVAKGRPSPLRALQMRPHGGIITEGGLRAVESRQRALEQGDLDFLDFAVRR